MVMRTPARGGRRRVLAARSGGSAARCGTAASPCRSRSRGVTGASRLVSSLVREDGRDLGARPPAARGLVHDHAPSGACRPTSRIVAVSSGLSVATSITSASMPSAARASAAASDSVIDAPQLTSVRSRPGRTREARSSGRASPSSTTSLRLDRYNRFGSRNTTGSGSRIAASKQPVRLDGDDGIDDPQSPGMWASIASKLSEWCSGACTPPPYGARTHQRAGEPAAGAVAQAAGVVRQLVEAGVQESHELVLDDRAARPGSPSRRRARRTATPQIGSVDHTIGSERVDQSVGGAEHAAVDADVLAEHDDRVVVDHRPDRAPAAPPRSSSAAHSSCALPARVELVALALGR